MLRNIVFSFSFIFYLLTLSLPSFAQEQAQNQEGDIQLIKNFIHDISVDSIRADLILSKHVLINDTESDEQYDYLEASIEEISLNLQTKNPADLIYIPFAKLPRKETRDIDPEGKPTDKMYFIKYKGRLMLSVYIAEDKIASFTLVSIGNNVARFVTY